MGLPRAGLPLQLGKCYATPAAIASLLRNGVNPAQLLARHRAGDWGNVSGDDWRENDKSCVAGTRVLSSYPMPDGERIWIITEANRSATTLLLPSDY
jgi:hypothetical protein